MALKEMTEDRSVRELFAQLWAGGRAAHRTKGKAEELGFGKDVYQSHPWGFR